MIINISNSKLFTVDPAERFAKECGHSEELWREIWRRHKLLAYTIEELCDYYHIKTKKEVRPKSLQRWLWRTEIYHMAYPALKRGARTVVSDYFGEHEWDVIRELTKNLKSSDRKNVRTLP